MRDLIKLTCENTETAMPYVDLVLEVLEYYVAHNNMLDKDAAHDTSDTTFDITTTNADRNLRVYLMLAGQVRLCDPKRPTLSTSSPDGCPA